VPVSAARTSTSQVGSRKRRPKGAARGRAVLPALPPVLRPVGYTPRRGSGLAGYERVLVRAGLGPVAGVDEAGRGACAGPLVVAAVALDRLDGPRWAQVADSKSLTARARETAYQQIVRSALAWHVIVFSPEEIDRLGLHVCNVAGMRRALAGLQVRPGYVLTDGFAVPGLPAPGLAMWKGDQVAVCVAAASIVAKVTRDRIMCGLGAEYPEYGFSQHKGYSTPSHMAALDAVGPSPVHRRSFVNVSCRLTRAELVEPELVEPEPAEAGGRTAGAQDGDGLSWDSRDVALIGSGGLDSGRDGPIVELIAGSLATAPQDVTGSRVRAPASSEGRT
jgi:ribonuclease HII